MKWISIHDDWPVNDEVVLLFAYFGTVHFELRDEFPVDTIFTGYWDNKRKQWCSNVGDGWCPFDKEEVTHWMPLPKGPRDL